MSLITANDLAKSYGAQDVFSGISLVVPPGARFALVGPNGVGKSTLLRLLVGLETPDRGSVQRSSKLKVGFLPQEATFSAYTKADLERPLWEYALGAFGNLRKQEQQLADLEQAMGDPAQAEAAMERYGRLQEAFELAGGYTYQATIRRVLNGLSFTSEEYDRPLNMLSGGERTRALLARLLLEKPDLLVFDEPTNHLDIEAIEWLEGWLRDFDGAALIVSHDRYFLDNCIEHVLELLPHGLERYRGNYTAYALQREERHELHRKQYQAQQEHVRREQDFIQRNIAGQKTRQAQGRRKRLRRLLRDHAIDRPTAQRPVHIDFGKTRRSGDLVLQTDALTVGFPEDKEPLFKVPDLILKRGECAAVIGPNGAGKTTFLRMLVGEVAPVEGQVKLGASLQIGYFAQAHEDLNPEWTVLEEIQRTKPGLKISEARNLLGRYLFSGDDVYKPVAVLSGGERGRLALAKLTSIGANLLLLDEPTTHLDLPSQEVLQDALTDFPGTILLVSHDRYLIEALATQVWAISAQGREMVVHQGGYASFAAQRRQAITPAPGSSPPKERLKEPKRTGTTWKDQAALVEAEERIHSLEAELADISQQLQQAGSDVDAVRQLGEQYAARELDLQAAMRFWEDLAKKTDQA
ncbi:MAG TPA: ABC-F family ATP-binding cassette domain-containing protein [Anaerolineae bacterium]|nr:ABC-F family ATP-binding cassette domain-containing protein [Anaerolineae bacterium]